MLSSEAIDAAIHISTQITNNRLVDSLNDLRAVNREHAWADAWSVSQQQLNQLGARLNGLIDDYNRLLAVQRETQQEMSKLKDQVERQREQIDEGQRYSKDLREVADIYRAEILRLDPDSFY